MTRDTRTALVRGELRGRHERVGLHEVWYAEDDEGVVALTESQEELERALREHGHRPERH